MIQSITHYPLPITLASQEHGANVTEIARLNNCRPEEIIDFSSSINPLGPSKAAELAIVENIGNIANYPQVFDDLIKDLANYVNIKPNNLFVDNGSASVIYKLFTAFGFNNVSILEPTFSEYKKAAEAFGCAVNNGARPDAIFICNPNNPTAKLIRKEEIESLARKTLNNATFLIVDEAFMDFVEDKEKYSAIALVTKFPNLIVIGSLTKFFALPGLRAGYACASDAIINRLRKTSPPWSISTITISAVVASLQDTDYIKKSRAQTKILRKDLLKRLSQVESLEASPSQVNFVLVKIIKGPSSTELYQMLAKKKILIRDCASFCMGPNFIRLAVKKPSDHEELVNALREVLN